MPFAPHAIRHGAENNSKKEEVWFQQIGDTCEVVVVFYLVVFWNHKQNKNSGQEIKGFSFGS